MKPKLRSIAVSVAGLAVPACAGWDNPTALADLQPSIEVEILADELETFDAIEIEVEVTESGVPLEMRDLFLEIAPPEGEEQMIAMDFHDGHFGTDATFWEAGENHIHVLGTPVGHRIQMELGELEVEVERHHAIIGDYRVEIEASPAPIFENTDSHIHFHVFEALLDGSAGEELGGLVLSVEVHFPDESEVAYDVVEEEPGEYEVEIMFGEPGEYELHLTIQGPDGEAEGEFHLPVLDPEAGTEGGDTGGGHTHG